MRMATMGGWLALGLGATLALAGCTARGYSTAGGAGNDYLLTPQGSVPPTTVVASGVDAEPISTVPIITMGVSVFDGNHNLQVQAGTTIQIQNTVDGGGLHLIYTGQNGQFTAEPGAPAELNSQTGVILPKGATGSYVFATAGTYYLTCSYHPSMLVKVTVTP